jgi:hypothetical protein
MEGVMVNEVNETEWAMPSGSCEVGMIVNCSVDKGDMRREWTYVWVLFVYLEMRALAHQLGLLDAHQAGLFAFSLPFIIHDFERC